MSQIRLIEVESYEEMSRLAAETIAAQIREKPDGVLGLATGSSPIGTYDLLADACAKGELDFSGIRTVNLDEYCGLAPDNPFGYRYFMNEHLFDRVNIDKANTFVPSGTAQDMDAEAAAYEARIDAMGGIDLQLLGIGHNGHIGFNEPAEGFAPNTHVVELAARTREANAKFFEKPEDMPKYAITMGVGTILRARRILLLGGPDKAEIMERAAHGPVHPSVPASALQLHPDVTFLLCRQPPRAK